MRYAHDMFGVGADIEQVMKFSASPLTGRRQTIDR
jgi:hypothetical protein